jgi:hypothetical protein
MSLERGRGEGGEERERRGRGEKGEERKWRG